MMIVSVQSNLKVLASKLGSEVISGETFSNIDTLVQTLPPIGNAILECRLVANQPQVDFSTMIFNPDVHLPQHFLSHPVWKRFQDICQEWDTANSVLNQRLMEICLEFDVDNNVANVPIPGLFLLLNLVVNWNPQLLLKIAQHLLGKPQITPSISQNIKTCFDTLPEGANIISVAAMLSRCHDLLRLNVSGLAPHQISHYLANVGWMGSVDELDQVIKNISSFTDNIVLSFDVGDRVLPRIGLECYLLGLPQHNKRWYSFYDYLISQGLCSPDKSKAVLAWPEFSKQDKSANYTLCTKIVYQPGLPLEAKAYMGFWPYGGVVV
ncbi:hypothetical protein [Cylindrospermum stagnale]|nr:hypothetical protein [Cylindrospermum stagnale]